MIKDKEDKLFTDFPPSKTSEWEEKINIDLKGGDYAKKLIWKTQEGFDVKPYYRAEDIENIENTKLAPGDFPYTRGFCDCGNNWLIRQDIEDENPETANKLAVEALAKGAQEVTLNVSEIESIEDLSVLLKNIDLEKYPIHFSGHFENLELLKMFVKYIKNNKVNPEKVRGSIDFDLHADMLIFGDFVESESADLKEFLDIFKFGSENLPNFKLININGFMLNSSGATISQELGYSIANGVSYIQILLDKGFKIDDILSRMMFSFSVGSNYFMEIAKFRAIRQLWAIITKEYKPEKETSCHAYCHATTSIWNKTLYDSNVNMLRTTTEAMSAIIGGCQSLSILPYDIIYKDADSFSLRIARNQQIILKEESYLDKVADPAGGSYYIETLTQLVANEAWKIFLDIENNGGISKAIQKNIIQDAIEASAAKRKTEVEQRKITLLGTNQFPNLNEEMLSKVEPDEEDIINELLSLDEDEFVDDIEDDEEDYEKKFKSIEFFGASDGFDELRLDTEKYIAETKKTPTVFLFNTGNIAMQKARAIFTSNFFGCAGYKVIDNNGFTDLDEGVKEALKSKAEIITLCSSDDEYPEIVAHVVPKIKEKNPKAIIVVAGYPQEHVESMKQQGVDEFIHVRVNTLKTLSEFHKRLSIY